MHPAISLMLRSPQNRQAAGRILARQGNRGDSMLVHVNPAEAMLLKRMGGSGTINPKTGLRQFDPPGGSNGGDAGGSQGGKNGGEGGGGNMGGGGSRAGGGGGDYNGQGRGWGGAGDGTTGGDLGPGETRAGESAFHAAQGAYDGSILGHIFGAQPTLSNSATYADGTWHTGFNPGSLVGAAIGTAFGIPGVGLLTGPAYHAIGGTDVVLGGPGAPATEGMMKGMGFGPNPYGGSSGSMGSSGSVGSGQHDPRGQMGTPGAPSGQPGAPGTTGGGTTPAPGATPAGLPPAANPALANLYYGGWNSDPFAGRFGPPPAALANPYLVAAGQPTGSPSYLNGLWR